MWVLGYFAGVFLFFAAVPEAISQVMPPEVMVLLTGDGSRKRFVEDRKLGVARSSVARSDSLQLIEISFRRLDLAGIPDADN